MLRTVLSLLLFLLLLTTDVVGQEQPAAEPAENAEGEVVEAAAPAGPGEHISEALDRVEALADVEVAYGAGVVSLSGTVAQSRDRENAETIASKFDGVAFVDNRIVVSQADTKVVADPTAMDAAIRERLERVFANVEELSNVRVEVQSGVVRLSGTTLESAASDKAEKLAQNTDGVVYVDSDIEEETDVSERISPAVTRGREMFSRFVSSLPLLGIGVVIIIMFVLLGRLLTSVPFFYRRLEDKPLLLGIVKQLVRLAVTGVAILFVLELLDLTALVGAVLGGAGLAGLAFGLAFKDIAENYLASIMLSVRRPFQKDDLIVIDDLEGKVVRLTTRETVLMTLDGNHLRVPNTVVFGAVITNFTRNPMRRITLSVGIGAGEDVSAALDLGTATLLETPGIVDHPKPFGLVDALGDFTVNLQFFAWVNQFESEFLSTRSEALRRLKLAFDHAGIDMPEPTRRVLQTQWAPPPPKPLPTLEHPKQPPERPSEQVDDQIEEDRRVSDEADLL